MSTIKSKLPGMQKHHKYDALWGEKTINKNQNKFRTDTDVKIINENNKTNIKYNGILSICSKS